MALIVEDGTGLATAESYVSVADCATYAVGRGLAFDVTNAALAEAALRRATAYVDTYRARFPGYRLKRRGQALEWPRAGAYVDLADAELEHLQYRGTVYDPGYDYIASNVVPIEIAQATCEAAVREIAVPGSMQPDLDRGGAIQELQAGSVRVVYAANAVAGTTTQIIDGILAGLLKSGGSAMVGRAVRG